MIDLTPNYMTSLAATFERELADNAYDFTAKWLDEKGLDYLEAALLLRELERQGSPVLMILLKLRELHAGPGAICMWDRPHCRNCACDLECPNGCAPEQCPNGCDQDAGDEAASLE